MNHPEKYMREALLEAREALSAGEFPVGCVMVYEDEIVSRGRRINSRVPDENELDHAEIMALRKLFTLHPEIERSRIVVYSTMEPCLMCYVTLLLNNIRTFIYAYEAQPPVPGNVSGSNGSCPAPGKSGTFQDIFCRSGQYLLAEQPPGPLYP